MSELIVRAALAEEENEGWVWIKSNLCSRSIVKMTDPHNKRSVLCQVRNIDPNFIARYNDDPRGKRIPIDQPDKTIVIGEWYRDALGGFDTTHISKVERELKWVKAGIWGWHSLRAACHHPDLAVRLGTRLGVLGAWLGILGAWHPIVGMSLYMLDMLHLLPDAWRKQPHSECGVAAVGLVIVVVAAAVGLWVCRGPRRPLNNKVMKQGA